MSISDVDPDSSSLSLTLATIDCSDNLTKLVLLLGQNGPTPPNAFMLLEIKRIQIQSNLKKKLPRFVLDAC